MDLRRELKQIRNPDCRLCPLHEKAKSVCVMGHGNLKSDVFVVGEAPGRQEDERGLPFIGAAGKLLKGELERAGIRPETVYFSNAAKCFPQGTPSRDEAETCASRYLRREISLLRPTYVLALGATALGVLHEGEGRISELRGRILGLRSDPSVLLFSTFHPSYVLRNRRQLGAWRRDLEDFATLVKIDRGEMYVN